MCVFVHANHNPTMVFPQPHTILLIQPSRGHESRTYTDYETVQECLEGACAVASSACYWMLTFVCTTVACQNIYSFGLINARPFSNVYRDMQDIWRTSETAQSPLSLHHLWHQPVVQICRWPLWPQLPRVRFNSLPIVHTDDFTLYSHMYNSSPVCHL